MRLVGPDGQQIGIKPLPEALSIARAADLDLVEVAARANPPVCRIMDYGKYKYEAAQKAKESRRKASNVSIKEMKYRPKISKGDFDTKTRKVERFLEEGHKVKVTLTFRGREMHHPELGRRILDQVVSDLALRPVVPALWHQFPEPGGLTGVVVLSESHLTCHTFPERGYAAFNLYCCRPRAEWPWVQELASRLGATEVKVTAHTRGVVAVGTSR